ncbi:hypothetical protein EYF80_034316 [Liparis tanakae]|uniref:Uncharacterized protein n=1 Tax=Liparis tanakae TaxID=230148 RepID=A0A4Z2GRY6_9TELE|nr:hypothetical protein EYF80_034316 [Liparis tanakae]
MKLLLLLQTCSAIRAACQHHCVWNGLLMLGCATNSTILCCISIAAQTVLLQSFCLLGIILLTSMLFFAKISMAFSRVASGRVRVRPRIQAKSTWKSLRMSVQEYTRAEFT